MKRKRIIIFGSAFALCAALLYSGIIFSKAKDASATSDEKAPYIIEYKEGEMKNVPEIDEALLNDPKHNLMVDYVDDFDYSESYVVEYPLDDTRFGAVKADKSLEVHVLDETGKDYVPTSFWNLTNKPYRYENVDMTDYVYTDFYFNVDSSNSIAVSMGTLDSNGTDIKISLCEFGSNSVVQQWTGNPEEIAGIGFCNLNQYKTYYVKFEANQANSVSGFGCIIHN